MSSQAAPLGSSVAPGPDGLPPRPALSVVRAHESAAGLGPGPLTKILQFLLDANDADVMAHRAVASLGLLPEVAWAELDGEAPGDIAVELPSPGGGHRLAVGLVEPGNQEAVAAIHSLLAIVSSLYCRELDIERLASEARTDPLTGLWNRRGFEVLLDQAIARAVRAGERISVVVCDIDHFKAVNDSLGHEAGDRALVSVARAVLAELRPSDAAARLGGDEMALLLSGCDARGAQRVAARLKSRLASVNGLARPPITLSMGIAEFGAGADPDIPTGRRELLRCADQAMYEAKAAGRDCIRAHESCYAPSPILEDESTHPICV